MSEYQKLKEEFDTKVKELEDSCPHKETILGEFNWDYDEIICKNCNKSLGIQEAQEGKSRLDTVPWYDSELS